MAKALIFDYGGTLDTNGLHWSHVLWEAYGEVRNHLAEAQGLQPLTWEQFREAYVYGERTLGRLPIIDPQDNFHQVLLKKVQLELQYLLEQGWWQARDTECREVVAAVAGYCNRYVLRHMETSIRLLDDFAQRYVLVLVSNFYGNVRAVLQDYGLHHFVSVIESAEVGIRKPDPAIYRMGVEAAGEPASACVVIGDSFGKDMVPAHSLGCETVWLKGRGWDREEVDESVPTHIITSLDQLASLY